MSRFDKNFVEPGLTLAAYPPESAPAWAASVDAILNVSDLDTPRYSDTLSPHIRLIQLPFEDGLPIPQVFLHAAVLELAALRQQQARTLVHCLSGQSRSATVIALYWMARDGMDWDNVVHRLRQVRPGIRPHPQLVGERDRAAVVGNVRAYLAGDSDRLHQARAAVARLWDAHRSRPPEPEPRSFDWNEVEAGLGMGDVPDPVAEVVRHGFRHILDLQTQGPRPAYAGSVSGRVRWACHAFPDAVSPDLTVVARSVRRLETWRAEGHSVYVHCAGGRSRSALIVGLYLARARGWDLATALWYLRRRRVGAWPHRRLWAAACWEDWILGAHREIKGSDSP